MMVDHSDRERERMELQVRLDAEKTHSSRNVMGQFATPPKLAGEIVKFGLSLIDENEPISFIDPALGTGAFWSALLQSTSLDRIAAAKGFELDEHYGIPAQRLWEETVLDVEFGDFTKANVPEVDERKFNFVICNPPYVRHHHIESNDKRRLQERLIKLTGVRISGLAGLYCYFMGLSHAWLRRNAVAGWLIPSEFMDVNYGEAVKHYLLSKVTLLRIHRFDPSDVQFDDALVSSVVVWYRNALPAENHSVEFSMGGSLSAPAVTRQVPVSALRKEPKWTRFPMQDVRTDAKQYQLSDFFTVKRGIATGDNKFFILNRERIRELNLPHELFYPILPSPRYVPMDEIAADTEGVPTDIPQVFVLNCSLPPDVVKVRYPILWMYLENGLNGVATRYLCRTRKVWYSQEERPAAPIVCTYLGRSDTKSGRPFRFILNHSKATAANVYLLLYPKPNVAKAIAQNGDLLRQIWRLLNALSPEALLGEGRVYGGGLHKLEPNELSNVEVPEIAKLVYRIQKPTKPTQLDIFTNPTARAV